ncbi:MAG: 50S ribosomal protein L9 [Candidatus Omnitrophota bacterium]|nr:50S ribosomal protein L9 [Candidatus Omnitrophota bacterium]
MEVILKKDVDKIGKAGAVVNVKEGFARNFLFPHDLAQPVTDAILKKLEQDALVKSAQSAKIKEEAVKLGERLSKLSLTIKVLTQGEEKLYGSINVFEISLALKEEGFDIDKNLIDLSEPIKVLGVYEVLIKLHAEVTAKVKLSIVKK